MSVTVNPAKTVPLSGDVVLTGDPALLSDTVSLSGSGNTVALSGGTATFADGNVTLSDATFSLKESGGILSLSGSGGVVSLTASGNTASFNDGQIVISENESGDGSSVSLNGGDVTLNINDSGGSMASRSGSTVININIEETDTNQIFGLLGRGLIAASIEVPTHHKEIDVFLGEGLTFAPPEADGTDRVMVQAGAGLGFDTSSNLVVNVGPGLAVNPQNQITIEGGGADFVGQGLVFDTSTGLIDVACGDGLEINSDKNVEVKVGAGLGFDENGALVATGVTPVFGAGLTVGSAGDIEVKVGAGLNIAPDGSVAADPVPPPPPVTASNGLMIGAAGDVEVNVGAGLEVATDGSLTALPQMPELGTGLFIDPNGRLAVNNTNPGIPESFKVLTDTQFSFLDSVLYIAKAFTTYTVSRADTGAVVSIDVASTSVETDAVTISGGYGTLFGPVVPPRTPDPTKPTFYKS